MHPTPSYNISHPIWSLSDPCLSIMPMHPTPSYNLSHPIWSLSDPCLSIIPMHPIPSYSLSHPIWSLSIRHANAPYPKLQPLSSRLIFVCPSCRCTPSQATTSLIPSYPCLILVCPSFQCSPYQATTSLIPCNPCLSVMPMHSIPSYNISHPILWSSPSSSLFSSS